MNVPHEFHSTSSFRRSFIIMSKDNNIHQVSYSAASSSFYPHLKHLKQRISIIRKQNHAPQTDSSGLGGGGRGGHPVDYHQSICPSAWLPAHPELRSTLVIFIQPKNLPILTLTRKIVQMDMIFGCHSFAMYNNNIINKSSSHNLFFCPSLGQLLLLLSSLYAGGGTVWVKTLLLHDH